VNATFPIITCDSESGCTKWTLDWYGALADNWRELTADGWQYNPHRPNEPHLCPEHAVEPLELAR